MDNKKGFLIKQFIVFNLIGIINTLVTYGIYSLLITVGVSYQLSLVGEYAVGIVFSFVMNKNITFRHITGNTLHMFFRMILTYIITFCINMALLSFFIRILNFNEYLGQFIALGIVSVMSFGLQKILVFKESKQHEIKQNNFN